MAEAPDDPAAFVPLERAPNEAIAGLWVSMLDEAGIHAYVPGTHLADEWAAFQRITGNIGADVFVARSRLEEARAVIARATADDLERAPEDGEADAAEEEETADDPVVPTPSPLVENLTRRQVIFEVLVVCAVVVLPWYVGALYDLASNGFPPTRSDSPPGVHLWVVLRWAPLVALVAWVMSRSGQPSSTFGWVRPRAVRDVLGGLVLLVAVGLATAPLRLVATTLENADHASEGTRFLFGLQDERTLMPAGPFDWFAFLAATLIGVILEELTIRGYLMVRLSSIFASRTKAAVISSLVFAGFHIYQGVLPTVITFVVGLVFSWAFFWFKSLWPLVIAHALHNVVVYLGNAD